MNSDALMIVPGFTPEQSVALRTVARQTAEETIYQLHSSPCTSACPRVEEVRDSVYGNGSPGLKTAVTRLEKDVASLVWWYRGLVVAVVSSWLAMLITYLQ